MTGSPGKSFKALSKVDMFFSAVRLLTGATSLACFAGLRYSLRWQVRSSRLKRASLALEPKISFTFPFFIVIDPIANLWAQADDDTEYAYEMCDAVEEDTFLVDGIQMSNFLHPAWFEPFKHLPGTKFDHLGLLAKPFSMTKGGYTITISNSSWHAVTLTTSLALSVVSTKIFETGWPSFVMSW